MTVPTRPLARSRRSSGTSSVTHVDRAMPRIWPATEPSSVSADQQPEPRAARAASRSSASTATNTTVAATKQTGEIAGGQRPSRRACGGGRRTCRTPGRERRREAEGGADDAGGDDRAGLEVHPERQGEPQERARHAADQRVDEQPPERVRPLGNHLGRDRRIWLAGFLHEGSDCRRAAGSSAIVGVACQTRGR